jgi:hypothetical protein
MSYEIIQSPATIQPVYNNLYFTVNSSEKTQCKYKYIADIYVYDDDILGDVLVETIKLYPEPYFGYGVFDVGRVLENYIKKSVTENPIGSIFAKTQGSILRYTIRFGEEFDATCTSTAIGELDIVSVTGNFVWNGVFDYDEFLKLNNFYETTLTYTEPDPITYYNNYNLWTADNESRHFLTNQPETIKVKDNEHYYLSFIQPFTALTALKVRTYDAQDNLLGDFLFYDPFDVNTDYTNTVYQDVACGPIDLNRMTPDEIITAPYGSATWPTVITQDVEYYKVWMVYRITDPDSVINLPLNNLLTERFIPIDGDLDVCGTSWDYNPGTPPQDLVFSVIDGPCEESHQAINGPRMIAAPLNFFQPGIYYQVTVVFNGLTLNTGVTFKMQIGETDLTVNSSSDIFSAPIVSAQEVTSMLLSTGDGVLRLFVSTPDVSEYDPYSFAIEEVKVQLVGIEANPDPLGTAIASAITEHKRFNVCRCSNKYEPMRLRFLNNRGGYDHFTFDLKSTHKIAFTRNQYSTVFGSVKQDIGRTYKLGDRGNTEFYQTGLESYTVNSNWISEEECEWLKNLAGTMDAYLCENIISRQFTELAAGPEGYTDIFLYNNENEFQVGDELIVMYDDVDPYGAGNFVATIVAILTPSLNLTILRIEEPALGIEILRSGMVYKTTSALLPINITSTDFEYKKYANQKLFNYLVEFKKAYFNGSQRG